jgi:hypothetical protein
MKLQKLQNPIAQNWWRQWDPCPGKISTKGNLKRRNLACPKRKPRPSALLPRRKAVSKGKEMRSREENLQETHDHLKRSQRALSMHYHQNDHVETNPWTEKQKP